jgi:hypothetical protein
MQKRERTPDNATPFPGTLLQNIHNSLCGKGLVVTRVVDPLHIDVEVAQITDGLGMDIPSFRLQLAGLAFRVKVSSATPSKKRTAKPCINCGKPPRASVTKPPEAPSSTATTPSNKTGMEMLAGLLELKTFNVKTVYGIKATGKKSALLCAIVDENGTSLVDSLLALGASSDGEWRTVRL